MESWKNGRRDLFDQLTKICDHIGEEVAAELDDKNLVRIGQEELRLLRENSKQVEKLAEHNARLADGLEKCREASSRVEGLEKENKRLAGELGQRLKQQQLELGIPRPSIQLGVGSKPTPVSSNPPSSAARIQLDESKMVTKEKYQSLVAKYNNLCEKYEDLKDVKKKMHEMLTADRAKIKDWESYRKDQDRTINQKNDKIQRLEEEIQRLRARSNEQRGQLTATRLGGEDQVGGKAISTTPLLSEHGSEVQVGVSSPIKVIGPEMTSKEHEGVGKALKVTEPPAFQVSLAAEDVDLPPHRLVTDALVEDTEFEPMEPHHTSSTEGDPDPLSPNKGDGHEQAMGGEPATQTPSSPEIEIISSRMIKKRKAPHGNADQKIKLEIKVEEIGSSPIGLAAFRLLNPNESIDLDDIGEKVDTPRKQRRIRELSRQASRLVSYSPQSVGIRNQSQDHANATEQESPGDSSQETPVRRRNSVLQPRSTNSQILPRTSDDRAPRKRRIASDDAVGELVEDGEIASAAARSRRQTSGTSDRLDILLAKPSPPKRVLSPARLARAGNQQARPSATSGLAHEFQHTDGEFKNQRSTKSSTRPREPHSSSSRGLSRESAEASRPSSKGSLRGSAEPLMPSSKTMRAFEESSRPTSRGASRGSTEPSRPTSKDTSRSSAPPSRPTSKGTPRIELPLTLSITNELDYLPPRRPPLGSTYSAKPSPRGPLETPRQLSRQAIQGISMVKSRGSYFDRDASDWEMDPRQEPLRTRPINKLSLSDFKVNPNYNQGYNHAFTEVVRDQSARKCLQGCTKPECCGHQFRILAEINRNPDKLQTLSQEEADDVLLDDFLGDNAYKVRNMNKSEKEELILQAKTRELANRYGRHRHSYQRRTSPPGFWRSDFPTTQEEMADREKAKEMARDDVEKRYKEAMRPGGAFIFRDE